jgi:hypothetical protein
MSTTTFPVSGSFGGRKSQPVRRAAPQPTVRVQAAPAAAKRAGWTHFFGNALATWASAGRLSLSE